MSNEKGSTRYLKNVILVSALAASVSLYVASAPSSAQKQQGATAASKPTPTATASPRPACTPPPEPAPQTANGISVGRPKVFDNRTLTIMLESLSDALRGMQTQFVNQQALAAAFNYLQGFQSKEVVSNLNITATPIPGLKNETVTTAGNVTAAGAPLPDTSKVTTTSDRPAFTPQAPPLDNPPAFQGFTPTYGENPSDLLSDQVNLTYQIFNIRMLLERSLSDRVLSNDDKTTRRQAVLGFNVTIDPPRKAKDAVAVVEVTLDLPQNSTETSDGLSLVSLMPQEKTYNAAALSTKSHAFGGAAVVKMFQVGYSERRRGQVFYLYRDNDTVSYERMNGGKKNEVIFGWMFRPVLGRNSVSPGLRQLFAIVALPADDTRTNETVQYLNAHVKTYWKKYDRDTMTSFKEDEANRAARLKYALTLNLTKPEIFSDSHSNTAAYACINVKPTRKYQDNLKPEIESVRWVPTGPKSALISITGNNFFSGTQVTLGDKVYASTSDGLIIKSNQTIDIATSLDALASGPGAMIGRYGAAVPLIPNSSETTEEPKNPTAKASESPATKRSETSDGIRLGILRLRPALSGFHSLEVDLLSSAGGALKLDDLPKDESKSSSLTPILTVNGNVVPLPYSFVEKKDEQGNPKGVALQALVPSSFLTAGGGVLKVSWPFRSDRWMATTRIYDPAGTYRTLRLDAKRIVVMTDNPVGFIAATANDCWTLRAGSATFTIPGGECKKEDPSVEKLSDYAVELTLPDTIPAPDKVLVVAPQSYGAAHSVDVPKLPGSESATPKPIALKQCDALWVTISVKDVDAVHAVEANQLPLKFRKGKPEKEGAPIKTIQVQITREISSKPGDVDITVLDKAGNSIGDARLSIAPQENCNPEGGKQ